MNRPMTREAQCHAVADVPPKLRVLVERFEMVRMELDARRGAMLARRQIAADDGLRPFALFGGSV